MITRKCDACGGPVGSIKQAVSVKFNNVEQSGKIKTIRVEDLCLTCQNYISNLFGLKIDGFDGCVKEADK